MSPRFFVRLALLPLALSLASCSTSPEEGAAGPPQGAPPAGGAAPAGDPALPAGEAPGAAPEGAPTPPEALKFSRFVEAGKETVTITVRVEGGKRGQIDIQSLAEKDGVVAPTVLHVEPFEGDTPVVITAPATFADALYVSALEKIERAEDAAPGVPRMGKDEVGGIAKPVRLEGKNLDLTIKIGEVPDWLDKLSTHAMAPPPLGAGAPPDGAPPPGGPPPAGAPPSGPPPAGAPPSGPPPAGAPPADGAK